MDIFVYNCIQIWVAVEHREHQILRLEVSIMIGETCPEISFVVGTVAQLKMLKYLVVCLL